MEAAAGVPARIRCAHLAREEGTLNGQLSLCENSECVEVGMS